MNDFGFALNMLRVGARLFREGWNGKGLYIQLQVPDENSKMTLPYIYMTIPVGASTHIKDQESLERVPWLASQTDLLANDWSVL